ncbi:MAG: hypothetical protein C0490_02115 [Marivirga sp.]|nr:hypothetical protein [Marivirga sp.]
MIYDRVLSQIELYAMPLIKSGLPKKGGPLLFFLLALGPVLETKPDRRPLEGPPPFLSPWLLILSPPFSQAGNTVHPFLRYRGPQIEVYYFPQLGGESLTMVYMEIIHSPYTD